MAGIIIALLCGVVIGFVITKIVTRPKPVGFLRIDESDPDDGPYLFLELSLNSPPQVLKQKKYVTMKVKVENFISHD